MPCWELTDFYKVCLFIKISLSMKLGMHSICTQNWNHFQISSYFAFNCLNLKPVLVKMVLDSKPSSKMVLQEAILHPRWSCLRGVRWREAWRPLQCATGSLWWAQTRMDNPQEDTFVCVAVVYHWEISLGVSSMWKLSYPRFHWVYLLCNIVFY